MAGNVVSLITDRQWEVEYTYNQMFADCVDQDWDGSGLLLTDSNPTICLYDYQKDAVQKIISTPNTLLAFDVGAGKTYIMIAAAMEMRKSGLSRKNMFVVPNNIVGQWETMFLRLYPNAKVLSVGSESFASSRQHKVLEQIQREDYDGIIIAYSCFEQIPLSSRYLLHEMHDHLRVFEQRMPELQRTGFSGAVTSIRREMDYVQKNISGLLSCVGVEKAEIPFDALDINTLFVDEAHNFKNIPLRTTMRHIRGINTTGSKKCMEMLKKVHFVQKCNGGRGAVFATGTPLCNSISDTYALQCYLQPEALKEKGLDRFDNWIKTFAQLEEVCEIDVDTSGFRIVQRFKEFRNLPELARMFGQVSIFHGANHGDLPQFSGYADVVIPPSDLLNNYMQRLYRRTETIRAGNVDRRKDNMLKVSTDGRKAALSLELVGEQDTEDANQKLSRCVEQILAVSRQFPNCSQLVFCDCSVPRTGRYNIYEDLQKRLIEDGIPSEEIAFIHSCKNEEQKLKLYEAVNTGKIRVLIGSTFKLGIGANVQTRLKAIHHLDVPWRPSDMVQREGRILRAGNEHNEVLIYRYIAEGSFDSYSWQILQNKQHFISQFLSVSSTVRTAEDLDNDELNYAQVKALALSEPLMKEYVEKENALRNARMVLRQELAQKEAAKAEIADLDERIQEMQTLPSNRKKLQELQQRRADLWHTLQTETCTNAHITRLEQELECIFKRINVETAE